jgi:hypothetical protein
MMCGRRDGPASALEDVDVAVTAGCVCARVGEGESTDSRQSSVSSTPPCKVFSRGIQRYGASVLYIAGRSASVWVGWVAERPDAEVNLQAMVGHGTSSTGCGIRCERERAAYECSAVEEQIPLVADLLVVRMSREVLDTPA